jgi:hypothetical protein
MGRTPDKHNSKLIDAYIYSGEKPIKMTECLDNEYKYITSQSIWNRII